MHLSQLSLLSLSIGSVLGGTHNPAKSKHFPEFKHLEGIPEYPVRGQDYVHLAHANSACGVFKGFERRMNDRLKKPFEKDEKKRSLQLQIDANDFSRFNDIFEVYVRDLKRIHKKKSDNGPAMAGELFEYCRFDAHYPALQLVRILDDPKKKKQLRWSHDDPHVCHTLKMMEVTLLVKGKTNHLGVFSRLDDLQKEHCEHFAPLAVGTIAKPNSLAEESLTPEQAKGIYGTPDGENGRPVGKFDSQAPNVIEKEASKDATQRNAFEELFKGVIKDANHHPQPHFIVKNQPQPHENTARELTEVQKNRMPIGKNRIIRKNREAKNRNAKTRN